MTEYFHIVTLGCKVNQYESQSVREAWRAAGAVETDVPGKARVILVHSCAVTSNAVADVRAAVRRLHRAAPDVPILVAGCAAQVMPDQMAALEGVTAVIPQIAKEDLKAFFSVRARDGVFARANPELSRCADNEAAPERLSPRLEDGRSGKRASYAEAPGKERAWPDFFISGYDRARPVVKVQDGCDHRCTYCIVPYARGASVSRAPEQVIAEVERLLGAGYREFILSGVNLRQYGRDLPGSPDFWDLVDLLERRFSPEWSGLARFRLSSLEPGQLGERALASLAKSSMVCPHLHLSLQSGSRSVLKRMGRGHYTPEPLLDFLASLGEIWPCFALGADILAGFPGETDAEFDETRDFCEQLPLTYAHVFPFSARPGTPAATMPGQLPKRVRTFRAGLLRETAQAKENAFIARLLAMPRLEMVVERLDAGAGKARGACQFYVDCVFDCGDDARPLQHELLTVRPIGSESGLILSERAAPERDPRK